MTRQQNEPTKEPEKIEDGLGSLLAAEKPPMFTSEEIEKIRADARKQVTSDLIAKERKRLLAEYVEEERAALGLAPKEGALPVPEAEIQHIQINLPKFCEDIRLDGKRYLQGHSYRVGPAVFASLLDQMQMSWNHEDQKDGKFTNFDRRERDTHLRNGMAMNAPMALNTRTSMN